MLAFDRGLDLVVALQELVAAESRSQPAVPVDEGAVAVEGRPAGAHSTHLPTTIEALCPPKPKEFDIPKRNPSTSRDWFGM
jgi:hypothetical protein